MRGKEGISMTRPQARVTSRGRGRERERETTSIATVYTGRLWIETKLREGEIVGRDQ
jgi:hypothetical protein